VVNKEEAKGTKDGASGFQTLQRFRLGTLGTF
jgi:hypothetical protein